MQVRLTEVQKRAQAMANERPVAKLQFKTAESCKPAKKQRVVY